MVSILTEVPEAVSPLTYCKFGDVVVPNYNWGVPVADEDLPYFDLGCAAPMQNLSGDVKLMLSYDGQFWGSNSITFTYARMSLFYYLFRRSV